MTTEMGGLSLDLPFIVRFATPIERAIHETFRYDERRQVSEILIAGVWYDAATARAPATCGTRMTKVVQETTDDD